MLRVQQLPLLAALLALGLGCNQGEPRPETSSVAEDAAVEQAIRDHLAQRTDLNLGAMRIDVPEVAYPAAGEAKAQVVFRAQGDIDPLLEMTYSLERVDGVWRVRPVSAGGAPPPGPPSGELPPNHPPVGGGTPSSELPPNHPPIDP